ncbi:MAG: carboxymuconolactone decarboxylase family protein [Rhodoferax sp.]|nr:carboxymuconolactone decarboxylase family protein [Rhodoferax sp.]
MTAQLAPLAAHDPRSRDPRLEELVGFVGYRPNALLTMARKPGLLAAVLGLVQAALRDEGELPSPLRFLVACEVSRTAGCLYSATHTVHAAHHLGVPWAKLAELHQYTTSLHYSPDERAALAIATAGGASPIGSSEAVFAQARCHFNEAQILEIVAGIALFGWFNRWNSLVGSELEEAPGEALRHIPWLGGLQAPVH